LSCLPETGVGVNGFVDVGILRVVSGNYQETERYP